MMKATLRCSFDLMPFFVIIPPGYCSSQGYAYGYPRNLHPAFKELAEFTSGQAILLKDHWELEKLDGLTGGVLEGTNVISIGSNMSGRKKRSTGGAADSRYNISVDESIEKMTVTVSTTKLDTRGWYSNPGILPFKGFIGICMRAKKGLLLLLPWSEIGY